MFATVLNAYLYSSYVYGAIHYKGHRNTGTALLLHFLLVSIYVMNKEVKQTNNTAMIKF